MLARNKKVASKKQINFVNANCARRPNEQVAIGLNMICIINQYHFVQAKMNQHRLSQLFYIGNSQIAQLETNQSEQEMDQDKRFSVLKQICQIMYDSKVQNKEGQIQSLVKQNYPPDPDSNISMCGHLFELLGKEMEILVYMSLSTDQTRKAKDAIMLYEMLISNYYQEDLVLKNAGFSVISYLLRDSRTIQELQKFLVFIHEMAPTVIEYVKYSQIYDLSILKVDPQKSKQNSANDKKKVPRLKFGDQLPRFRFFLDFESPCRFSKPNDLQLDLVDQTQSMLIMYPPLRLQKLYRQVKQLAKAIINRRQNGISEIYFNYLNFYGKTKSKNIAESKEIRDKVHQLLLEEIDNSTVILMPNLQFWGIVALKKIYINLSLVLHHVQKIDEIFKKKTQQIQQLMKASMCLTLLHELAHILITKWFEIKVQFQKDQEKNYLVEKKQKQSFYQMFNNLDLQVLKLIVDGKIEMQIPNKQTEHLFLSVKQTVESYKSQLNKLQSEQQKHTLEKQYVQKIQQINVPKLNITTQMIPILTSPVMDYLKKNNPLYNQLNKHQLTTASQNIRKILLLKMENYITTLLPNLLKQICQEHKNPFGNAKEMESGFIIESAIFRKLPQNDRLYVADYEILQQLTKVKDLWTSMSLRYNFSSKKKTENHVQDLSVQLLRRVANESCPSISVQDVACCFNH